MGLLQKEEKDNIIDGEIINEDIEDKDELSGVVLRIQDAMNSDDEIDNDGVERYYKESTADQQKAIDRVFIALCGYSLRTLIEEKEDIFYNPFQ